MPTLASSRAPPANIASRTSITRRVPAIDRGLLDPSEFVSIAELNAAVVYYGTAPEDAKALKAWGDGPFVRLRGK